MNSLVQITELKTGYWEKLFEQKVSKPIPRYDDSLDTLFIYFSPRETGRLITHQIDSHVAFLYRYSDKEIVGMRIDKFEKEFLSNIAEPKVWRLSNAGVKLNGICDLVLVTERTENHTISQRIANEIKAIEPVFA